MGALVNWLVFAFGVFLACAIVVFAWAGATAFARFVGAL